jgi:hypothetical protein
LHDETVDLSGQHPINGHIIKEIKNTVTMNHIPLSERDDRMRPVSHFVKHLKIYKDLKVPEIENVAISKDVKQPDHLHGPFYPIGSKKAEVPTVLKTPRKEEPSSARSSEKKKKVTKSTKSSEDEKTLSSKKERSSEKKREKSTKSSGDEKTPSKSSSKKSKSSGDEKTPKVSSIKKSTKSVDRSSSKRKNEDDFASESAKKRPKSPKFSFKESDEDDEEKVRKRTPSKAEKSTSYSDSD